MALSRYHPDAAVTKYIVIAVENLRRPIFYPCEKLGLNRRNTKAALCVSRIIIALLHQPSAAGHIICRPNVIPMDVGKSNILKTAQIET